MNTETAHVKYPRTPHLPWSPGADDDDIILDTAAAFEGMEVVVTEKMDGENTTMYHDHIHARSIDSKYHPSREWVKRLWGSIAHRIPENERICGENMFWVHSIIYTSLESYFLTFSWWEDDVCLDWDETVKRCEKMGITTVPVLYRGVYDEAKIKALYDDSMYKTVEGYVIRPTGSFKRAEFQKNIAKFVRKDHVQTDQHWMRSGGERNMLKVKRKA